VFLKEAQKLLSQAGSLYEIAGDITNKVQGPLMVGCLLTVAQIILPSLRMEFQLAYPDVRVRQFERNQEQLFEMLQRGEIDLALTYNLELWQGMTFEPLMAAPANVVLPTGHRLADNASIAPHELADEPMVLLDLPYSREYFLSVFHLNGIRPNVAERTADISVMRTLIANGFGFGIANINPPDMLAPDGKSLVVIPLDVDIPPLMLGLALPNDHYRTQTVQAFIDHCRSRLAGKNRATI
jgi:DNA-binding transcriptional LysR family regulator